MKKRELVNMGYRAPEAIKAAQQACAAASAAGQDVETMRSRLRAVAADPSAFVADPVYGALAQLVQVEPARPPTQYAFRSGLKYACWGDDIEPAAHDQMRNACRLPVTVAGALMPDAHVGYGLPIGGVLATENAVIPYAVGVDIACRVKMTVFDLPTRQLEQDRKKFEQVLERNTVFGVGKQWRGSPPQHDVLDADWSVAPVTRQVRDLAWRQLGTSGSGNHFVEFGEVEFGPNELGVAPGAYVAVVSHSGSRGPGATVCKVYSEIARELHPDLPPELKHLAWLPMDGVGAEYWAAMELMGLFASANHAVIHDKIARDLGASVVYQVENHHNFAWKENHCGRELIVHRKGATPAGRGALGYIPGSMTAPGYLVQGLGEAASLDSASHGAGRRMSRKQAVKQGDWHALHKYLRERRVHLLSAGLDESPLAYKDIDRVMAAQQTLVRTLAKFQPRVVKMAPDGERPED